MKFREAILSDLEFVADHTISRGCFNELPNVIDHVYALEHEGVVLGIGGLKILNPHTAWCWMDWTEYSKGHIYTGYRIVSEWLDIAIKEFGLTRIMAAIEPDFNTAIRTVEHLGFHLESEMPGFFGEKPGLLYVRMN